MNDPEGVPVGPVTVTVPSGPGGEVAVTVVSDLTAKVAGVPLKVTWSV